MNQGGGLGRRFRIKASAHVALFAFSDSGLMRDIGQQVEPAFFLVFDLASGSDGLYRRVKRSPVHLEGNSAGVPSQAPPAAPHGMGRWLSLHDALPASAEVRQSITAPARARCGAIFRSGIGPTFVEVG